MRRSHTSLSTFAFAMLMCRASVGQPQASRPKPHPRVVFVVYEHAVGQIGEASLATDKPLVDQLQQMSEVMSTQYLTVIPFRVGNVWTIAPETRSVLDLDLARRPPNPANPDTLIGEFLAKLTRESVEQLGSENGILMSDLPREEQETITAALSAPFQIVETGPRRTVKRVVEHVTDDPKWDEVRLRARLRMTPSAVKVTVEGVSNAPFQRNLQPQGLELRTERPDDGKAMASVPNRFQSVPGGPATLKPIGISGQVALPEVIRQLHKVTGLSFYANRGFSNHKVHISDPSTTCKEVMQCLALALESTWRVLDKDYVLSWEQNGIQGAQIVEFEARSIASRSAMWASIVRDRQPGWVWMADTLPFAEDDPFALTDTQRATLFGSGPVKATELHYSDLTASQREYVEQHLALGTALDDRPGQPSRLIVDEKARQSVSIQNSAGVELSVLLPSTGWVGLADGRSYSIGSSVRDIRDNLGKKPVVPQALPQPTALTPVKERALMVGRLSMGHIQPLMRNLSRHGVKTLFYPILQNGYSSFPSAFFPLDPLYKGADAWAAVSNLAAKQGVKVVGYVSTLSWRAENDRIHWLDKHPDWMDRDALGRTTLEWRRQHPELTVFGGITAAEPTIYVRPTEPEVQRRLAGLVTEFAKRKGAAGIALVDWKPLSSDTTPLLQIIGCAVPDRVRVLHERGYDPVDIPLPPYGIEAYDLFQLGITRGDPTSNEAPPISPYVTLANSLVAQAKRARPDWTTYVADDRTVEYRVNSDTGKLKADVVLNDGTFGPYIVAPNMLLHLWPAALNRKTVGRENWDWLPIYVSDQWLARSTKAPVSLVVSDFRCAMEDVDASLAVFPRVAAKREAVRN